MPDLPEEAVQAAADDLEEAFKNVPFRFWTCINKTHKYVTWNGDVASCDTCGLTSEMTRKRDVLVRADERRKVAEEIRAIVDDSGPYPMDAWRAFKSRHKRLVTGDSIVAVLLAVADEIEGEARESR